MVVGTSPRRKPCSAAEIISSEAWYWGCSSTTAAVTSETTAWAQRHVQSIPAHHGIRVLLVTGSYLLVFAVLFAARFAVYEVWIFSGRSRVRAAFRSRIQVRNAARANRTP